MSTSIGGETARIYEFPKKGPARPECAEFREDTKRQGNVATLRLPDVVACGAWYHEAAVRDAEQGSKH